MINTSRVGKWITEEGEIGTPDPTNPYRYVRNDPTNATDPSGLAEIPAFEDAPTGGWATVKDKEGQKAGAKGTFKWKIETNPRNDNAIRAEFWFEPTQDCPSRSIGFLQVVQQSTLGGQPWYGFPKLFVAFFKQFSTTPELANCPDISPLDTWLFYGAEWDRNKSQFTAMPGFQFGAGGPRPVPAYTNDIPSTKVDMKEYARQQLGAVVLRFETAVITLDSYEVLGVLKWGFKIDDKPGSPIEILGGGPGDFSLTASDEFKKLIEKANSVEAIKHKIKKPDTSKINCGGTSALP